MYEIYNVVSVNTSFALFRVYLQRPALLPELSPTPMSNPAGSPPAPGLDEDKSVINELNNLALKDVSVRSWDGVQAPIHLIAQRGEIGGH